MIPLSILFKERTAYSNTVQDPEYRAPLSTVSNPPYTTLHYTTLHYTILHYTALHCTALHYTTLPSTSLPMHTQLYDIKYCTNNVLTVLYSTA